MAFARSDFNAGDVIPQGPGRSLRVVDVLDADPDAPGEQLPVLVVEIAE